MHEIARAANAGAEPARCAFVTGASGFLGSFIVRDLLACGFERVYVLVRGTNAAECEQRLRSLWWERLELASELRGRVQVVCGDVTCEQLGIEPETYARLARETTHIVHAAAEVGVNSTARRFAEVNVGGTLHALLFAEAAFAAGGLQRFVHVSTVYVAGTRTGAIGEDELPDTTFNSLYEQSKFGAEQLARDAALRLPVAIVRPAQIVGDTRTGFISTFNTLYYPLKLYLKGKLSVAPVAASQKLNMAPVDFVSGVVVRALTDPRACSRCMNATLPSHLQPTAQELLSAVREWAVRNLSYDPGQVVFAPVSAAAAAAGRKRNLAVKEAPKRKSALRNMLALSPYFDERRTYATANTKALVEGEWPDWTAFLPRLLEYATRKGFLNHTGRTVFEQMLVRLSSQRNTITYYDVSREGMRQTRGAEAKDAILNVAAALQARGVQAGDRVVLVGVNSTRYFMADAAVGLLGATSVPVYYTSPADDVVKLAQRSNAKLAFVGAARLLQSLPARLDMPVVSLLDDACGEDDAGAAATSWKDFLAKGACQISELSLPQVPFDATATIRYTSGTTGEPKGVMFDHYQLRWMGEVMPTLLDWRTRCGKLRYLSFLPMSHVVEGILVAYAPYYLLSDIEMYYLNDFDALVETLPKVRPTLFFSVPRFYEKVWDQFASSPVGRRFCSMDEGPAKRALARVARAGLLRKAGLDRCRQLIVGSAPVGMDLLENFRSLGIEIHNAYGVTEAPLIALSRLGENELGSVGALLPETSAELDDEGEILVAGPQVARAYDGAGACTDARGRFATGDFGSFSAAGNLVIGGRKKELVVTSYGKNISPEKVETLLKGIAHVSEALLVGEARPYVCALVWLEDDARESFGVAEAAALDAAMLRCNQKLSHPEQVKRWAVMDGSLSIAAGELTPNLKLRRRRVAELYAATIDALYTDAHDAAPATLHVGAQA